MGTILQDATNNKTISNNITKTTSKWNGDGERKILNELERSTGWNANVLLFFHWIHYHTGSFVFTMLNIAPSNGFVGDWLCLRMCVVWCPGAFSLVAMPSNKSAIGRFVVYWKTFMYCMYLICTRMVYICKTTVSLECLGFFSQLHNSFAYAFSD